MRLGARVGLPVPAPRTEAPARHGAKLGPATNRPLGAWATSSDKLRKTCKPTCAIPWHRVPPTSLARSREDPAANNRLLLRTRSRDFRRIVGVRPAQVQVVRAALHEDPVVARAGGAGPQEAAAGPRVSPAIRPACKMGTLKVLRNVPGVVYGRRVRRVLRVLIALNAVRPLLQELRWLPRPKASERSAARISVGVWFAVRPGCGRSQCRFDPKP